MVLFLCRICASGGYTRYTLSVYMHRNTYAANRCRSAQHRRTFIPLSLLLWNDFADPVFVGVGLAGFMSRANAFHLPKLLASFLSSSIFIFSSFFLCVGILGLGSLD